MDYYALINEMVEPASDAPQESKVVKMVEEGYMGYHYNLLRFGDHYWAVHWQESEFNIDRIMNGKNSFPMFMAEAIEEIQFSLKYIHDSEFEIISNELEHNMFDKICNNFYYVRLSAHDAMRSNLLSSPVFRNRNIPLENLFDPSDVPITIISPAPARTCNYRCPYCYHHDHGFTKNSDAMGKWRRAIQTAAERIQRPIHFSAGAMGEPLLMPEWRETAIKLLQRDNVSSLALVSNLSQSISTFFDYVDAKKVGLVASLHPTEFDDEERDFGMFLDKLSLLKSLGVDVVVNYVLTPDHVMHFSEFRKRIRAIGVPMTSNVVRGGYNGKFYPDDFTEEELEIVKSCYEDNFYIFDSQSHHRNPYGLECVSGRIGFYLEFDGIVYNCHFARQRLGSIYDSCLMVRTQNGYCTASKCESQTTIGWQTDVARCYQVQKTLHHYVKINDFNA